ncbi:8-oxo-dGTP pyrophosphatase MutT, NUDIX family [Fulvimarina manganoxydans]|uniref:8-oxo-dGTP pyrophosphatase MutT, NUDIX family n=1 Tax=Fulvimarina manganoxydans TaxID=937218 RepID=A0A1W1ZPL5_9HYPH|nr:NUDIX domain-containing protein [Fulvimarina manganoxydans]SMC50359.1 8-oxo-dGTP pyrophosphatase MutT, NUDIX family [Fulvimarina manganoxydans]
MTTACADIKVAAVMLFDADGRMLLVRKRGTRCFMQPGGKAEPGESFRHAACRELHEEIGLQLSPEDLIDCGVYSAEAANEPGSQVVAHVFAAFCITTVKAAAEIEELVWIDPGQPANLRLAPLTANSIYTLARGFDVSSLPGMPHRDKPEASTN